MSIQTMVTLNSRLAEQQSHLSNQALLDWESEGGAIFHAPTTTQATNKLNLARHHVTDLTTAQVSSIPNK
ncbi:MAG TPA: hypothetical protein VFM61_10090 [Pseudidiomarina sp.]|nr:hypothetical protein [Pseudidiomarina sp.]